MHGSESSGAAGVRDLQADESGRPEDAISWYRESRARYQQLLAVELVYKDSQYNRTLANPVGDQKRFQVDLARPVWL